MIEELANTAPVDVKYQVGSDRRRCKRVPVDFTVVSLFPKETISGQALNGCNEGLMVEYYLSSGAASTIIETLSDRLSKVALQFTHNKRAFRAEGEPRHFHLDHPGDYIHRIKIGFFIRKME